MEQLGILAGGGQFPLIVAQNAAKAGLCPVAVGFYGHTDENLPKELEKLGGSCLLLHLGQLTKMLAFFKKHHVQAACMAGTINKPRALDFRPDLRAARVVFSLKKKGDDSLLRAIVGELEKEGIQVVSAAKYAPVLHILPGLLTPKCPPNQKVQEDIAYAWPVARQIGAMDIGQCLVVREGMVMAVEALEGTDETLARGARLGGKGCVAIKMLKPGQEERVDLPSIGLKTVQNLVEGQYAALAVEAGALFFDKEQAIALAEKHGISIVAKAREE